MNIIYRKKTYCPYSSNLSTEGDLWFVGHFYTKALLLNTTYAKSRHCCITDAMRYAIWQQTSQLPECGRVSTVPLLPWK